MTKLPLKISQMLILSAVLFALFTFGAKAQSVQLLGDFKDWSAYATSQGSQKLCFVLSKPKNVSPEPENFTKAYLYLTHRPAQNIRNEFNFVAGFTFAPNSEAILKIGGQSYELFTKDDAAWLADNSNTKNVAGQMRAGSKLIIEGKSTDGTMIVQTFSLSGVTAASRAIDRNCN